MKKRSRRQYRRRLPSLITVIILVVAIIGIFRLGTAIFQQDDETSIFDNLNWKKDCPKDLLTLYDRNPDARSFVKNYAKKKGKTFPIDLSEYQDCKTVPLLMQWDERWGYATYAGEVFGLSGCGPTCLSMVAIYLKGDTTMDPLWMGKFSTEHGFSYEGQGTMWSLMTEGAVQLGLEVVELPLEEERIVSNLEVGNPIICIVGPGDFTTTGHFIVLTGYEDGKIKVNDPNSYRNSEKTWTYEQLQGQIQNLWAYR